MLQLILASQSPRRRDLLEKAGYKFTTFSVNVSEYLEKNLTPDKQILAISRRKAEATLKLYKHSGNSEFLMLSADTMVMIENVLLGKPSDSEEAEAHLRLLSGRTHQVKTGMTILHCDSNCTVLRQVESLETTLVTFRPLSNNDIEQYIATGEPFDKAGSYGIQGSASKFVTKIDGSFENVVGLPIQKLKSILTEQKWLIT